MSPYVKGWLVQCLIPLPIIILFGLTAFDLVSVRHMGLASALCGFAFLGLWFASGAHPKCPHCREPINFPMPSMNGVRLFVAPLKECSCGTDLTVRGKDR